MQRIMIIDAQGEISYLSDDKISQISVMGKIMCIIKTTKEKRR